MNIAEKLSDYSYSINFENLPKEVIHEVKKRVIDSLGCAMGAFNSKPCKIARDVANLYSGKFAATILGTKNKSSVSLASFSNCAMVRYLDFHDPIPCFSNLQHRKACTGFHSPIQLQLLVPFRFHETQCFYG